MQIGISIPQMGPNATPPAVRDVAQAAEDLGFDSVLLFDHIALPRTTESMYDLGPQLRPNPEGSLRRRLTPFYECVATLAYLAGVTARVRLQTSVCVLPLRQPLYNARQIASIDAYSGGRVTLGVGAGWLQEEAAMLDMPWEHRGARTDEHILVLRTLWEATDEYVSFHGRFYHFDEIDPAPFPAQRHVPILIGGHTAAARRRAARLGDGWLSWLLPPEAQQAGMEEVRSAAHDAGRDPRSLLWYGAVEVPIDDAGRPCDAGQLQAYLRGYQALGVHSVGLRCNAPSAGAQLAFTRWFAEELLQQFQ